MLVFFTKKHIRHSIFSLWSVLVTIIIVTFLFNNISLADTTYNTDNITIEFPNVSDSTSVWYFPYSDDFFSQDPEVYDHTLARGSLGMAVASFRNETINNGNFDNIKQYFDSIGFENLYADPFLNETTTSSVTYAIASKKIGEETVIAAVCCGAGYGKEWAGNLTIGTGVRHEGFETAALKVESAIAEYIEKNGITGDIVLWTTGFSRAAAIANVLAADGTDSGYYNRVYAYTFATPRTTKDPGDYKNIFNIVAKDDPVPTIPFADWGFKRYGVDMFIRSIESDGDYENLLSTNVRGIYSLLSNQGYMFNIELNSDLRTLKDYLYQLIPTVEKYATTLQPAVLGVFNKSDDGEDYAEIIKNIITEFEPTNEEEKETYTDLLNFMEKMANRYVLKGNAEQVAQGAWDPSMDAAHNLTMEHDPNRYISWMFSSDDISEIFSTETTYQQLVITGGNVNVDIYDDEGFIQTINSDGTLSLDIPEDTVGVSASTSYILKYIYEKDELIIIVPGNQNYLLIAESPNNQTLTYYAIGHSADSVRAYVSPIYTGEFQEGAKIPMYFGKGTQQWDDGLEDYNYRKAVMLNSVSYSPGLIMKLQHMNFMYLSVGTVLAVASGVIALLLLELLVFIILGIIRLCRRRPRHMIPTVIIYLTNALIFLGIDISLWYFVPAFPVTSKIARAIEYLFILVLALIGLWRNHPVRNIIICACMFIFMSALVILGPTLLTGITAANFTIRTASFVIFAVAAVLVWVLRQRNHSLKLE